MKTEFKDAFLNDLKKVREKQLRQRVRQVIEVIEAAQSLSDVPNLKKLKGTKQYFRVRIGDYGLGLALELDVVIFVRLMNRKDIYKFFP